MAPSTVAWKRLKVLATIAGAAALTMCREQTAPLLTSAQTSQYVVDELPFVTQLAVGTKIVVHVVAFDSLGGGMPVDTPKITLSNPRMLRLDGDTLSAWSVGVSDLIITGTVQGVALTSRRRVLVRPG
jgi:hypothetical protein